MTLFKKSILCIHQVLLGIGPLVYSTYLFASPPLATKGISPTEIRKNAYSMAAMVRDFCASKRLNADFCAFPALLEWSEKTRTNIAKHYMGGETSEIVGPEDWSLRTLSSGVWQVNPIAADGAKNHFKITAEYIASRILLANMIPLISKHLDRAYASPHHHYSSVQSPRIETWLREPLGLAATLNYISTARCLAKQHACRATLNTYRYVATELKFKFENEGGFETRVYQLSEAKSLLDKLAQQGTGNTNSQFETFFDLAEKYQPLNEALSRIENYDRTVVQTILAGETSESLSQLESALRLVTEKTFGTRVSSNHLLILSAFNIRQVVSLLDKATFNELPKSVTCRNSSIKLKSDALEIDCKSIDDIRTQLSNEFLQFSKDVNFVFQKLEVDETQFESFEEASELKDGKLTQ